MDRDIRNRLLTMAVTLVSLVGTACTETHVCTTEGRFGLNVTVRDAQGPVCGATVTAVDGDYSETLMTFGGAGVPACPYTGAAERAGTYTITVVSGARSKTVTGVVVGHDECHVIAQTVTVMLD